MSLLQVKDRALPYKISCYTGNAQVTIASSYRVSPPAVSRIIHETCRAIWTELQLRGYLASWPLLQQKTTGMKTYPQP